MADSPETPAETPRQDEGGSARPDERRSPWPWIELIKVLALPLVTLVLGYWFNASLNERQQVESNIRLYAEMMGRREEADSNLRKDMFNSILSTFITRDPASKITSEEVIRQQILSLELLAYNFHDSLDIGPLFMDVERRISLEDRATNNELRRRLESVAQQVIEQQLTTLSDVGTVERGGTSPAGINDLKAHIIYFGTSALADPQVNPGTGTQRLCMSSEGVDGTRHYRQFMLEPTELDAVGREVRVRFYVSQPLTERECKQVTLDLVARKEVETNFKVGLFDFPVIDNTRLSGGERTSISLTTLTPDVMTVAIAYFPASRASLKDKPYYDDVIKELVRQRPGAAPGTQGK